MKNHFIFSYFGNKRKEVKEIYEALDFKDKKIIIEPFCGSSAMSYYISTQRPREFKYILNDNDEELIKLYEILRDRNTRQELLTEYKQYLTELKNIEAWEQKKSRYIEIINNGSVCGFLIKHKLCQIRHGLFPPIQKCERMINLRLADTFNNPIINFLETEDIEFTHDDGEDIHNKYKGNEHALIILDPPYMLVNNKFYKDGRLDIYQAIYKEERKHIKNCYLIAEYSWIIEALYGEKIIKSYSKKYTGTARHRISKHSVINF